MPEFTGHNDLRSYLRVIWRWKLLFVALLIAAPAVTYLLERGKPKIYQSHALVYVNQATIPGTSISTTNVESIAQVLTTTPVADIAGKQLNPPQPGSAIIGSVSAAANPTTDFIKITVTDQSPTEAAAVANAFSKALKLEQQTEVVDAIDAQIRAVQSQLRRMSRTNPNWSTLQSQLASLQTSAKTQGDDISVLQAAMPDYASIGPHLRRSVELGFVIGLLLAFGAVMLAEGADRRMRSPDDLELLTDLSLLAAIPPSAFSSELETGPIDEEAFQMLRTSLTYFTTDRTLASVLITSPGEKEGKSTVAARLALVAAQAGLDVVLVDADLRRAGATNKFAIQAQAGLGAVLSDQRTIDEVTVNWPLTGEEVGRLRIIPAGPPPINASAMISSPRMRSLLEELEQQSDLLIIDSPAALAVSDAVPLMRAVSGIVLVARMNRSSRDTIGRLQKIIASAQGNLLGVVATGVSRRPYEKYSHDYYAPEPSRGRRSRRSRSDKVQKAVTSVQLTGEPDSPAADA